MSEFSTQPVGSSLRIAVAIVQHHGKVVIGKREQASELAGFWEFPGGKIEAGESIKQAAQRECLEETGLMVQALKVLDETRFEYEFGVRTISFLACRCLDEDPLPKSPFRWVELKDLSQFQFPPANAAILRQLEASLLNHSE